MEINLKNTDSDMENSHNRKKTVKQRHHGAGFAILLILAGTVFLLLNTEVIPAAYKPIIISWQMLLIVLGIWTIASRRYIGGLCLLLVGGIFMWPLLGRVFPDIAAYEISLRVYWPVLLIVFGLFFVLPCACRKRRKCTPHNRTHRTESETSAHSSGDYIEKSVMFDSPEQIVFSQNFTGGDINVMFGSYTADLRKAAMTEGKVVLNLKVMFGAIYVYVPQDWRIEIDSGVILGSFDDNRATARREPEEQDGPVLYINAKIMFGAIELKN